MDNQQKANRKQVTVLVNPQTKQPTVFRPGEGTPLIYSGQYQNVTDVPEKWVAAQMKRANKSVGDQICDAINAWEDQQDEIDDAIAVEREACAQLAAAHYTNTDPYRWPEEIAAAIRARK